MALRLMDIRSIVVGGGALSSLIVLVPATDAQDDEKAETAADGEAAGSEGDSDGLEARQDALPTLPIRIGSVEAAAISMGIQHDTTTRPMTHDLLLSIVEALGGHVEDVRVVDVRGTTFFAQVNVVDRDGVPHLVDARPSDAVALAVRVGCPILADDEVLSTASLPDFGSVEQEEQKQSLADFHSFVESVSPDDFRQ